MSIRSPYRRTTSLYGRAGVVARHALREVPGGRAATPPEEAGARLDRQTWALEAVRTLPEPYRSAVYHCVVEGIAPAEVARRLGIRAATVEARLREARRLVDARLGAAQDRTKRGERRARPR